MVYAARNYVRPSDELRPSTLEIAREMMADKMAQRKLASVVAVIGCMLLIGIPIASRLGEVSVPRRPSSGEIQVKATSLANDPSVGANWAVVEAFTRMRQVQASEQQSFREF